MKKLLFILLAMVLFSCSKADGLGNFDKTDLQGVWNIESEAIGGTKLEIDNCKSQSNLHFFPDFLVHTYASTDKNGECIVYEVQFDYDLNGISISVENPSLEPFTYFAEVLDSNTIRFVLDTNDSELYESVSIYKRS